VRDENIEKNSEAGSVKVEDVTSFLIIGMYILLVFCLVFFFVLGKRIQQMDNRIQQFEVAHHKEIESVKVQVEQIKENIDKTKKSLK
jgi:hypothetical protein